MTKVVRRGRGMKCKMCARVQPGRLGQALAVAVTAAVLLVAVLPLPWAVVSALVAAFGGYQMGVDYGRRFMREHGIEKGGACE